VSGVWSKAARRALALQSVALFLGMSSWFTAAAVLPQLKAAWALEPVEAAALTIAVQLGFVAGALLSALLTLPDRIGPRRLILVGALLAGASTGALALAADLSAGLALRALTGFGLAFVYPPFVKLVASWFREGRGTAMGVMLGALTLGTAAPHLVRFAGGADWRLVCLLTAAMSAAGGLLAELAVRDGPFPFARAPFDPRQIVRVAGCRGARLAALGYFGHMWELYAMWTWFPAFAGERFAAEGLDASWAALYAGLAIALGVAGCYVGGRLSDRHGRAYAAALAMALSGAVCLSIGWSGLPFALVLALGAAWGFWVNADSAQFTALVSELSDQAYVGTAVTVQLALGFLLTNLTLALIPALQASLGWGAAFAALAPGPLLGALAMRRLRASGLAR
jgi:MFS family permease